MLSKRIPGETLHLRYGLEDDDLKYRELSGTIIRHRLAALSSLFEDLCKKNAAAHNRSRVSSGQQREVIKEGRRQSVITSRVVYCRTIVSSNESGPWKVLSMI